MSTQAIAGIGVLQLPVFAVRLSGAEGDDAIVAPVSRAGVEQQHCLIVQAGYMRMPAADNISTSAQAFIQQAIVIVMNGETIAVADEKPDTVQGCFNQALTAAGAIHISCHA